MTSRRLLAAAFLCGLFGFSVVACSESTEKGAIPTEGASSQIDRNDDVPQVVHPLDATPFLKHPCQLVDDKFLARFGDFEKGEPDVESSHAQKLIGPTCVWYGKEDFDRAVSVIIDTPHQKYAQPELRGLGGLYASKKSGSMDYLQPVQIPGHSDYPAVIAGKQDDMVENRACVVYVGISDDLTINTSLDNADSVKEACEVAQNVAAAVLDTLKQAD